MTSNDDVITLRTYLEAWEKSHIDRHTLEQERRDVERAGIVRALDISTAEYARRLDFLNGEAERLRNIQATYVPREVYENYHKQLTDRLDRMSVEIDRLKLVEANLRGQIVAYSAAIGLALSIVTFALNKIVR